MEKTVQSRDQANLPIPINYQILKSAETTVDRTCSNNELERPRSEKMARYMELIKKELNTKSPAGRGRLEILPSGND